MKNSRFQISNFKFQKKKGNQRTANRFRMLKNPCPSLPSLLNKSVFIHVHLWTILLVSFCFAANLQAQIAIEPAVKKVEPQQIMPDVNLSIGRYLDLVNGMSADDAVRVALEKNGEIKALRNELESTRSQIRQAELRPNPRLQISGTQEGIKGNRYSGGAAVTLPLELGNRRGARIDVAENEFKVSEAMLAESERRLATDVRLKFGDAIALIEKLRFLDELVANVGQGYKLISAKVIEGSNAPLEQNMSVVELNRIRSMREMAEARVGVKLLELRNVMGIEPMDPLRLKGDFDNLLGGLPSLQNATTQAIVQRPDLESLRLNLGLGNARLEQARSEARLDAGVSLGFQRMTRIMPRISNQNPVEITPNLVGENFITFGVDLMLPVRNKNQGNIESRSLEIQAAQKRLEFGELTVRSEIAAAFLRFESAARALTIYQNGVTQQARENLRVVWQTYEFGDKDLIDYIGEERRYLELENNLIDAELEVYRARIEILRAINAPELISK